MAEFVPPPQLETSAYSTRAAVRAGAPSGIIAGNKAAIGIELLAAPESFALPSLSVRYENLSAQNITAEFQKDILVQMLHERFPGISTFLDASEPSSNSDVSANKSPTEELTLTCVRCSYANDTTLVVEKSLQKFAESAISESVAFQTRTAGGKSTSWKISLRTGAARYFIAPQLPVSFARSIREGSPIVMACLPASRCNIQNSFDNASLAQAQLDRLKGAQAARLLAANAPFSTSDVVFAPVVKQSDQVRVVYRAQNSGLRVNSRGKALGSGVTGQNIRVELYAFSNTGTGAGPGLSGRIIEGTITGPSEVEYAP